MTFAVDIHNEFIACEKALVFYAGKAVLNKVHRFLDRNWNDWVFVGATGFTFKVWEEREGGIQVIDWDSTNFTQSSNDLILNAPASDTEVIKGKYYYEIEQIISGGYTILLAYGEAKFI